MSKRVIIAGAITLLTFVGAHVLFAAGTARYVENSFVSRGPNVRAIADNIPRDDPRLIARHVDINGAADLIGLYAKSRMERSDAPDIILAGSSVSYGFGVSQNANLAAAMTRVSDTPIDIGNVAITAYDVRSLGIFLCELVAHDLSPDLLLVEIPVVNEIPSINGPNPPNRQWFQDGTCPPDDSGKPPSSLFQYFLRHPWGVHTPSMLSDRDGPTRDDAVVNTLQAPPATYNFTPADIASKRELAKERLQKLISVTKLYDVPTAFFRSPLYRPVFDKGGLGPMLDSYDDIWRELCTSNAVVCIDTFEDIEKAADNFYNLTHFNAYGAETYSVALLGELQRLGYDVPTTSRFVPRKAPVSTRPDNSVDLDGPFEALATRFFLRETPGEPDDVIYFRPLAGKIRLIQSNGERSNQWTYMREDDGRVTFTFIRRFADGRKQQSAVGTVEFTESGWTERTDGTTDALPATSTVSLMEDGSLQRTANGRTERHLAAERLTLPPLTPR
ncbi:hypothetical protein [uncultured Algimonas sp.]|uniref:hypothetical protein n=1 Tax=uncultured Algimonas sp. TaxID=1547920 RepID=UPI00260804D2|nr:hypothetical protein [uncultured Algimonas sp.]